MLDAAVRSVLTQSLSDLEVVVVANRPGLDLSSIAGEERVRLLFEGRPGKSWAVNRGLAASRGRWVAFLDDDDLWDQDKLAAQFELLQSWTGLPAVHGQYRIVDASGTEIGAGGAGPITYDDLLRGRSRFLISSLMVESDLLVGLGGLDVDYPLASDLALFHRLTLLGSLAFDPVPRVSYRLHRENVSRTHYVSQYRLTLRLLAVARHQARLDGEPVRWLRTWRGVLVARRGFGHAAAGFARSRLEAGDDSGRLRSNSATAPKTATAPEGRRLEGDTPSETASSSAGIPHRDGFEAPPPKGAGGRSRVWRFREVGSDLVWSMRLWPPAGFVAMREVARRQTPGRRGRPPTAG